MHYVLYVELPGFYVREWERRDPSRAGDPIAVHRDKRILDLNSRAMTAGLCEGMGLEEAKALLQGMGLIFYEEEPYRAAERKWLDVLSEFSSVIEPDRQHSAWADVSGHPSPIGIAGSIRKKLRATTELKPRIGLAGTKWLAKLASEILGDVDPALWAIAVEDLLLDPATFLSTMPTALLLPLERRTVDRLRFLGYRTIGEVSRIPLRTLKMQFGDEALKIHACAKGGFGEAVKPLYPPDMIREWMSFEGGIGNSEELKPALEMLARKLAKSLSDRGSHGAVLEGFLSFEEATTQLNRTFSSPIRTARNALSALSRLIGTPSEPVHAIEVRMPGLKKAVERQSGLYAARVPGDDVAMERAMGRLRSVFGDKSLMKASEKVEPRRVRVLRAWSHATGWK